MLRIFYQAFVVKVLSMFQLFCRVFVEGLLSLLSTLDCKEPTKCMLQSLLSTLV